MSIENKFQKEIKIVGKVSPKRKTEIAKRIDKIQMEGRKRLPNELEKDQEKLRQIALINSLLKKEIASLGVTGFKGIEAGRYHFLDPEQFKKYSKLNPWEVAGCALPASGEIFIKQEEIRDFTEGLELDWDRIEEELADGVIDRASELLKNSDSPEAEEFIDKITDDRVNDVRQFEEELNSVLIDYKKSPYYFA